MKLSRYNFIKNINGEKVLFNANTCVLAVVNDDFFKVMDEIDSNTFKRENHDSKLISDMVRAGCIVEDNEFDVVKIKHNMHKYQNSTLVLTILPTMECNFRCKYCFEEHIKGYMSQSVQDGILQFIKKRINTISRLQVMWFGGEPMLYKNIIYSLSERIIDICKKNNVKYSAGMVSNGSLFDQDDILKMNMYRVHRVQFTIDGIPSIHNARRINVNGGDSFHKIIEVTNNLLASNVNVNIRINIDKENIDDMGLLFKLLKEKIVCYDKLSVTFGKITPYTDICKHVEGHCYNSDEFDIECLKLYKELLRLGFSKCKQAMYPKRKYNNCGADIVNSFVVDMDGYLYKCWNQVGKKEEICGDVYKDVNLYSNNYLGWVTWSPVEDEICQACKFLPICMGGCPQNNGDVYWSHKGGNRGHSCSSMNERMDRIIEYYYALYRKK